MQRRAQSLAAALFACAPSASAGVLYTAQDRSVTVLTSADGATQTAAAADFSDFQTTVALSTVFPTPGGGQGTNRALAGIDCQLDPNRLRLFGTLSGSGGLILLPDGGTTDAFGNAAVAVNVSLSLAAPSTVSIAGLSRPDVSAEDKFKIKLKRTGGGSVVLFSLDESSPPQPVDSVLALEAGDYNIEYQAEVTVGGDETVAGFGFQMVVHSPDINGDGRVNTLDLIQLLASYGQPAPSLSLAAAADVNADGVVDTKDLAAVLTMFGATGI